MNKDRIYKGLIALATCIIIYLSFTLYTYRDEEEIYCRQSIGQNIRYSVSESRVLRDDIMKTYTRA